MQQILFTNDQISLEGLPQVEALAVIPLEPSYKTLRYVSASLFALAATTVAWVVALSVPGIGYWGLVGSVRFTLIGLWNNIYSTISFRHVGYAGRVKDISFKSGWLWLAVTPVPFNRVQHCDIRQGILDRKYGLARLTIYTAGGQSSDLMIPGLLPDVAEKLKAHILGTTEQLIEADPDV